MIFKKVFLILLALQISTILNSKLTHYTIIEVRYSETDSMSYTHHSNYLKFYEIGRLSWFKNIGLSYRKFEETGIIMPVVDAKIKYRKPSFFEDELKIQTTLISKPNKFIEFEYVVYKNNEVINEGYTKLVFFDRNSKKPIRCPKNLLDVFNN